MVPMALVFPSVNSTFVEGVGEGEAGEQAFEVGKPEGGQGRAA